MEFYNACTFGYCAPRGFTRDSAWEASLDALFQTTGCDVIVLPVVALQDHAYSTRVEYRCDEVMSFDDVRAVAARVRALGKRLILKAMVNCRDGYWRAYIHFFDQDIPTEPGWGDWFPEYAAFCADLAALAQEIGAALYCVGCEMVGTDRRTEDWAQLISAVRARYRGPITYNCDKYQEDKVSWWNLVDVMSSSGYYPIDDLPRQFDRIRRAAQAAGKPFLFMECGCPSREGSERVPNNWSFGGHQSNEAQRRWYAAFGEAVRENPWVRGVAWWDWSAHQLYDEAQGEADNGYALYGKPAAQEVRKLSCWVQEHMTEE